MDERLTAVWKLIDAQQKGREHSAVWNVGEQLRDILWGAPELAEIVEKDLCAKGMGLADCEGEVKKLADARHKETRGGCVSVSMLEVYPVIRKFYGLPEEPAPNTDALAAMQRLLEASGPAPKPAPGGGDLTLEDFF